MNAERSPVSHTDTRSLTAQMSGWIAETASPRHVDSPGRRIWLFESEVVEAVRRETEEHLTLATVGATALTAGVYLAHLVNEHFWIGPARAIGLRMELCPDRRDDSLDHLLQNRGGLAVELLDKHHLKQDDRIALNRGFELPAEVDGRWGSE